MLLEVLLDVVRRRAADQSVHLRIVQARLRLALEQGILDLDGDHGAKPLAHVVRRHALVNLLLALLGASLLGLLCGQRRFAALLQRVLLLHLLGVVVDGRREGSEEAREVRAAVLGVDAVDKRVDDLLICAVVLECNVIPEVACAVRAEVRDFAVELYDRRRWRQILVPCV